ncbi:hypothetical protein BASA50_003513 [Batrachochytrium salamandrivorans]|uniref:Cystathionine gamma-synthase n=1 Tax=Batrachochytrium salamandrivorans TaxID=1357716 RepID=A0ABQ8FHM6_9FUNG|nr:hypothetical protein BASA62_003826 [Batrachochytrium salamandrivorans]KAH6572151.1 hypothetical protein BASA60_006763 [Batrachochytrium salamandrivorans]KAH6598473.1 hypothetical protein BASA50_003513 [Batrachochytrium salamandrivorans]KAH6599122.1 hypothetical protein BASA61_002653 [Batrachochytrium salamandrivorans]KAH9251648.1 hypothetical protein BASA81_010489 [Batrachochytrium salamandrivorans]
MSVSTAAVLGIPIPPDTPHAISVALPTWKDNVGYEEGDRQVVAAMRGGYPRFVFAPLVKKLFNFCCDRFAFDDEDCLIFSSRTPAEACRTFMRLRVPNIQIRIAELLLTSQSHLYRPPDAIPHLVTEGLDRSLVHPTLHIVIFHIDLAPIAKQFWQHTGEGISSRFAENSLRILEVIVNNSSQSASQKECSVRGARYDTGSHGKQMLRSPLCTDLDDAPQSEIDTFVEERYGRNLDLQMTQSAKVLLRQRIAGMIGDIPENDTTIDIPPTGSFTPTPTTRGISTLSEKDVFLYPCGMSAIYNMHRVILGLKPNLKSVQFGFPYTDTLKIQEKFGPGCHFLGHGNASDMAILEKLLSSERISAVFCEFPSNPLLQSPDLSHLWRLTRAHDCLLIVDETIGNFSNVKVLPFADMVVSSLTKVFSGDSNVMGGSVVLNPQSSHYQSLYRTIVDDYNDTLWGLDAIFLERNSRTFAQRCQVINENTLAICDYLHQHPKVEAVLYPKFVDTKIYTKYCRNTERPGYGGLFSLILKTDEDAVAFYDAIQIYKGPSLGTNFTLACPYTILAHYTELEWAASFKVPKRLVRISVGTEDVSNLLEVFSKALEAV